MLQNKAPAQFRVLQHAPKQAASDVSCVPSIDPMEQAHEKELMDLRDQYEVSKRDN